MPPGTLLSQSRLKSLIPYHNLTRIVTLVNRWRDHARHTSVLGKIADSHANSRISACLVRLSACTAGECFVPPLAMRPAFPAVTRSLAVL